MTFKKNSSFNVLYTDKLEETKNFYEKIGAEIKEFENDKVVVGIGDFDLHFILSETEPFEEYKFMTKEKFGSGNIFYIEVEDLESVLNLVENSNGKIITNIKGNHWECKEFLCEDPNGYRFGFYCEI